MAFNSKRDLVYMILAGVFITNAITAEMIGGKIIHVWGFTLSVGIVPWPVVFLTTDIINEYFGKAGVRKLSVITASLIAYVFILLWFAGMIPAFSYNTVSQVSDDQFHAVFGQSQLIIIGSIIAFLVSQMIDLSLFWVFRKLTGEKMIWLRSTGSTVISQLFDSFIVTGIAFWLPGKWSTDTYLTASSHGYIFKLILAVSLTPLIYIIHAAIRKYLGHEAEALVHHSAIHEGAEKKVEELVN
jgi:uncharacterized integral membrane protein (TIGR00697 family)